MAAMRSSLVENDWKAYFDELASDENKVTVHETEAMLEAGLTARVDDVRVTADRLRTYLNQAAKGEIGPDKLRAFVTDLHDNALMRAEMLTGESHASLSQFADRIETLVIGRLLSLLSTD